MTDRMIIGIGYKAGSGKDELAKILVRDYGFLQVAFADKMKKICIRMFGWESDWPYTAEGKATVCPVTGRTVREVLQLYGEAMRKTFGYDIWVKILANELSRMSDNRIVISDVRYNNEFDFVKKYGIVCRIDRPDHLRLQSVTQGLPDHPSEVELDAVPDGNWNAIVVNDAGLDKLEEFAETIVDVHHELHHGLRYRLGPEPVKTSGPHNYEPDQQPVV